MWQSVHIVGRRAARSRKLRLLTAEVRRELSSSGLISSTADARALTAAIHIAIANIAQTRLAQTRATREARDERRNQNNAQSDQ